MPDEFGCNFATVIDTIYKPDNKETSLEQQIELGKGELLREYSLNYPEYDLVFDRFTTDNISIIGTHEKAIAGHIVFRAYLIKGGKIDNNYSPCNINASNLKDYQN